MQLPLFSYSFFCLLNFGLLNLSAVSFAENKPLKARFSIPKVEREFSPYFFIQSHHKVLENVHEALAQNKSSVVIVGPKNVGKTELASQLFYDWNMEDFQHIIWINASNENMAKESFCKFFTQSNVSHSSTKNADSDSESLSCQLDLENIVQEISLQLDGRTLLIFDNAAFDLVHKMVPTITPLKSKEDKLPAHIQILVTTRDFNHSENWGGHLKIFPLEPMTQSDLVEIVLSYLDLEEEEGEDGKQVDDAKREDVLKFCSTLMELAKMGKDPAKGLRFLANTIESIQEEAATCYYDRQWKDEEDEKEGHRKYNKCVLRRITKYIADLNNMEKTMKGFSQMEELFQKTSEMMKLEDPFLQAIIKGDFEQACQVLEQKQTVAHEILDILDPGPGRVEAENAAMTMLSQVADCRTEVGHYDKARTIYEQVEKFRVKNLGENHVDTLTTRHYLAIVLLLLDQFEKGLLMLQNVYEGRLEVLGPDHKDTIATMHVMADMYIQSEILEYEHKAMEFYTVVHKSQEAQLGEENSKTLDSLSTLAQLQMRLGEYKKALESHTNLYEIRKKILGPEHEDTMAALDGVSGALTLMGDTKRALPVMKQVYELCKKIYGPEDPRTLRALAGLSLGLAGENMFDHALKVNDHAYKKMVQKVSKNSPHVKDILDIKKIIMFQREHARVKDEL